MNDLTTRVSERAGWLVFVAGLLVVVAYGGYQFAVDDTVSAVVKTAVAAVVAGLLLLLISVLRRRLADRKTERYEDVKI